MKHTKVLAAIVVASVCAIVHAANPTAIIPAPAKAEMAPGNFQLRADTRILAGPDSRATAELLAARLRPATGFKFKIKSAKPDGAAGDILLTTQNAGTNLGAEGYELSVTTNGVVIRAGTTPLVVTDNS